MSRSEVGEGATERHALTLQEKHTFIFSRALGEMAQYTFGFICSVVAIDDEKLGRHCGSALRCMLGGRRAVLTARHVIDAAMQAPKGLAVSTGNGRTQYIAHGKVHIDSVADLAAFFVPDDYPDFPFWPSERLDRSSVRLSTDFLFLHGFPGSASYPSRLLGGVVSKSLPYGAMQRLENLPTNIRPFQFALEYDPVGMMEQTGEPQDIVDPHGLSGSPVWRIGASGRPVREWQPSDCLLVGILTEWAPSEKVLIASSVKNLPSNW